MTEENTKPLSPEEMIPIRERHAIALRMADCDDETDSSTWYALDVGRLLATIAAEEAEIERLKNRVPENVSASARVIALYLTDYCDDVLPYYEMIAEASRRAYADIAAKGKRVRVLEAETDKLRTNLDILADCVGKEAPGLQAAAKRLESFVQCFGSRPPVLASQETPIPKE